MKPRQTADVLGRVPAWVELKCAFVETQMRARRWVTR